jgi:hypothetical protein
MYAGSCISCTQGARLPCSGSCKQKAPANIRHQASWCPCTINTNFIGALVQLTLILFLHESSGSCGRYKHWVRRYSQYSGNNSFYRKNFLFLGSCAKFMLVKQDTILSNCSVCTLWLRSHYSNGCVILLLAYQSDMKFWISICFVVLR